MLLPRMQRWALTLAAYEYQIIHRPGQSIPQADALNRLPVGGAPRHVPVPADTILTMQYLDMSPVTASDIRRETSRDPVLSQVFIGTRDVFPDHDDNELLKPYTQRRDELSIHDTSDYSKCPPPSTVGRTAQRTLWDRPHVSRRPQYDVVAWYRSRH